MGYARIDIKVVPVTKNMTRLLQPLDLTTNASVKKMEKRGFSDYFTSTITKVLENEPNRDVATIEVDFRLSTLKQIHAMVLMDIYDFLRSETKALGQWGRSKKRAGEERDQRRAGSGREKERAGSPDLSFIPTIPRSLFQSSTDREPGTWPGTG